jgi:hypothetical protein
MEIYAVLIVGHKYDKLGLDCHSVDINVDSYLCVVDTLYIIKLIG